jgi:hypothetical protein
MPILTAISRCISPPPFLNESVESEKVVFGSARGNGVGYPIRNFVAFSAEVFPPGIFSENSAGQEMMFLRFTEVSATATILFNHHLLLRKR